MREWAAKPYIYGRAHVLWPAWRQRATLKATSTMKALSASIIVLAAAVLITGGSHIQHGDTKLFVQAVGCLVGIMGLGGWFVAFKNIADN